MKTTMILVATFLPPLCAAANTDLLAAAELPPVHLAQAEPGARIDLPAQALAQAIQTIAQKTNINILVDPKLVRGKKTSAYTNIPLDKALMLVLADTGLTTKVIDDKTITVVEVKPIASRSRDGRSAVAEGMLLAQTDGTLQRVEARKEAPAGDETPPSESAQGIPEILVKGKRSLNTDIARTEDAPQPYVVFGAEEISRSQASSVEDFLRMRLPMHTGATSNAQFTGAPFTNSSINLRGLGTNQTLILVDGRRMPGVSQGGIPNQPDLNGIPLSSIERIEVLPSTAGGIYGGSATGGVINVVLRRDFQGVDIKGTYANTFDTDAGNMRMDLGGGFALEGGRTQVTVSASYAIANNLTIGDRDFSARAVALQLKNNPSSFGTSTTPPLGATVNIRSVSGNLQLDTIYGGATLVSSVTGQPTNFTYLPLGYAGPASDSGAALRANAGRYNLEMPGGVGGKDRGLLAAPAMRSISLNARREFGRYFDAFIDVSHLGNLGSSFLNGGPTSISNLPADAPNNPFQQAINVSFPTPGLRYKSSQETATDRANAGIIARLPGNWTLELDYAWSRARMTVESGSLNMGVLGNCVLSRGVAANVDPDGAGPLLPCAANDPRPALNALQEGNTFPLDFSPYEGRSPSTIQGPHDSVLKNPTLRFSGPVLKLPGGALTLSGLAERREQDIEDSFVISYNVDVPSIIFYPSRYQQADSFYLEARAPLVAAGNSRRFVRELEFQVSGRYDDYETAGVLPANSQVPSLDGPFPARNYTVNRRSSADYTMALRYKPVEDLTLRASVGTGFNPPAVNQIAPQTFPIFPISLGTDPKRGNTPMYTGAVFYTYIFGGNPALKPEFSDSLSAGLILTPRFMPGVRLSVDYTRIDKVDEIQSPNNQFLLDNEDLFPGRIVRGTKLAGDAPSWAGPIILFDTSYLNVARTTVEAFDIQVDYTLEMARFGALHGYAIATRQAHSLNRAVASAPTVDLVGYSGGPLAWRGNFGVDWDKGPWTVSWNSQYYDSYWTYTAFSQGVARALAVQNQGSPVIPSQLYHDVLASYRFEGRAGMLAGAQISVGIQNLFDSSPPILASTDPSTIGYSGYGDPRLRRYSISIRKSFN